MTLSKQTEPVYQTLLSFASSTKLLLLHPCSRYRSLLVARLLADKHVRAFYCALGIDDINLRNFLAGITRSLLKQHPTFGRQLNLLPADVLEDPYAHLDTVLSCFIAELAELADGEFYLILDEFDRADLADDVHRFVERLAHAMPNNCKIILNGRSLPRLPWLPMIAKRHTLILRDGNLLDRDIYNNGNTPNASLKVLSLGPGYVFLNDSLVDHWAGHLPRLLLFYVMEHPMVTRNQICKVFWPNLEIDQAVNVFHVTKRRLHKALGMDILAHDGRYYRIDPSIHFYFDAFDFVEALLEGRHNQPAKPSELWQKIDGLYRGPFLQGHNEQWILERREAYCAAFLESLEKIAEVWVDEEKYELALQTLKRAIDADFSAESSHLKLLKLYVKLGRPAEAVTHYRELERWAKKNKLTLNGEVQQLYSDIIS